MRPKKRCKLEFSQRIVLVSLRFSVGIVLLIICANFVLLWMDKQPMTQETVTAITVYGGVMSGMSVAAYSALTAIRNHSHNKHVEKCIIMNGGCDDESK
jgi:nitrate reductase gamma subunit